MGRQYNKFKKESMRRIVNTKLHGILDYITAFVLVLPWIVNYHSHNEDTWKIAATGGLIFLYSSITNYEFGLVRLIPMKVHLILDVVIALFLIATPWLFEFNLYTNWTMFVGITSLLIVLLSSSTPFQITRRDLDITKP
jgi:hypothetical protein